MKLALFASLALLGATAVPVAAEAAPLQRSVHERTVVTTTTTRRAPGYAYRHRPRRVCRTEFRHHRRVQVCRTVRR